LRFRPAEKQGPKICRPHNDKGQRWNTAITNRSELHSMLAALQRVIDASLGPLVSENYKIRAGYYAVQERTTNEHVWLGDLSVVGARFHHCWTRVATDAQDQAVQEEMMQRCFADIQRDYERYLQDCRKKQAAATTNTA